MSEAWSRTRAAVLDAAPCSRIEGARAAGSLRTLHVMASLGIVEYREEGIAALLADEHPLEATAAAASLQDEAVICLHSAAWLHGLTDRCPEMVHLASGADTSTNHKRLRALGIALHPWKNDALSIGVGEVSACGKRFQATNRARTVLDIASFAVRPSASDSLRALAEETLARYLENGPLFRVEELAKALRVVNGAAWIRKNACRFPRPAAAPRRPSHDHPQAHAAMPF